ncbi:MAG: methyltransferase domain-containing protein [Phycisphaerae bacterium]|nr:methyltransferase domain-containing protein [Phycisphaerae bacterium]
MDDPGLDPASLHAALAGLRRLNSVSLADPTRWRPIARESSRAGRVLRVLDLACADGAWAVSVSLRAARRGLPLRVDGCDINPRSVAMARRRASAAGAPCAFFRLDALRDPLPDGYDVITASLFLHHLTDPDAQRLLERMGRAARRMVVLNDLVRSRLNLGLVRMASRALTRSPVVHDDAARSVRAALTRAEFRAMAERAGLRGAVIGFGGLGRMSLVHRRTPR